jgi:aspartate racemase
VTIGEIKQKYPDARHAGVLATDGLLAAGIYQKALTEAGLVPVLPGDEELARLMTLIARIKSGDKSREVVQEMGALAELLASAGADVIIAGCTEIPLVLDAAKNTVPIVASTDVLARKTIALARGLEALDSFVRRDRVEA